MRAVLPGKPQAYDNAFSTVQWNRKRLVAYITKNTLNIFGGPHDLIQSICVDEAAHLSAVVIDERSGSIAVASSQEVYIYVPCEENEAFLRWGLFSIIGVSDSQDLPLGISWGTEQELLVASSSLRLYDTVRDNVVIWQCELASPAKVVQHSPDGELVASIGWYDRLVKVWRRQSFDPADTRFDFSYLPHPAVVSSLRWRKPPKHHHTRYESVVDHVLYTICEDVKVRIWAASDTRTSRDLRLWTQVDMQESLQPRIQENLSRTADRTAFFIDSDSFVNLASVSLQQHESNHKEASHVLDHLEEIVKKHPDICIILDIEHHMSAWGFHDIGSKALGATRAFNVAHVADLQLDSRGSRTRIEAFPVDSNASLAIIVHHFDGRITWYESPLEDFLSPMPCPDRIKSQALWQGPDGLISKAFRGIQDNAFMLGVDSRKVETWLSFPQGSMLGFRRQNEITLEDSVTTSIFLDNGNFTLCASPLSMTLWDTRQTGPTLVQSIDISNLEASLTVLMCHDPWRENANDMYIALVSDTLKGTIYSFREAGVSQHDTKNCPHICEISTLPEGSIDNVTTSSLCEITSLKYCGQHVYFAHDHTGNLYLWLLQSSMKSKVLSWKIHKQVYTAKARPSMTRCSPRMKVAMLDAESTGITIWDLQRSEFEYEINYKSIDTVRDIKWSGSLLAVATSYDLNILVKSQFDYSGKRPPWITVKQFSIKDTTSYPLSDAMWLSHGTPAVCAGNQIYVWSQTSIQQGEDIVESGKKVEHEIPHNLIRPTYMSVASDLASALPLFQTKFLRQVIAAGDLDFAHHILVKLHEKVKFFAEGDYLDPWLDMSSEDMISKNETMETDTQKVAEIANLLQERLQATPLPLLSQNCNKLLIDCVQSAASMYRVHGSLDVNAMQFCFFASFAQNRASEGDLSKVDWRNCVWALHSSTQEALVDVISRQSGGKILRKRATELGMFMWIQDIEFLKAQFELVARNEYASAEDKDPIQCSLYYLALRKKTVLRGLWRMVSGHREQAGTQKMLANDFTLPRWKTAALKNAYALLGKRRFEYAAAWFLLADQLQDAVNICVNQMQDWQLGYAIARVYGGEQQQDVVVALLRKEALPLALKTGNRWLASWAFWLLGEKCLAAQALLVPLEALIIPTTGRLSPAASFMVNEPTLIHAFAQIRSKIANTANLSHIITPREEWEFVIGASMRYQRMGCDILSVRLLRYWKLATAAPVCKSESLSSSTSELDGQTTSNDDDDDDDDDEEEDEQSGSESEAVEPTTQRRHQERKPTTFTEPAASDLLDSFGF